MKNETIVDRVVQRIQTQPLGDLIVEEDLYDIIKEAIPMVFFEDQVSVEGGGYNSKTITKPPLIVEVMREVLKEHAKKYVEEYFINNSDKFAEYFKEAMDVGFENHVKLLHDAKIKDVMTPIFRNLIVQLNNDRTRMGLNPLYM